MKELKKLRIYNTLLNYVEFISFTMVLLMPVLFIFISTFDIFLIWFAFVGMFILAECKGIEINNKRIPLEMKEFINSPEGKNYFHKMKP